MLKQGSSGVKSRVRAVGGVGIFLSVCIFIYSKSVPEMESSFVRLQQRFGSGSSKDELVGKVSKS